jgi:hypothetical protein
MRLYYIDNLPGLFDLQRTTLVNVPVETIPVTLAELELRCRHFLYTDIVAWRAARARVRELQLRLLEDAAIDIIREIRSLRGNDDGSAYDPATDVALPGTYAGRALNEMHAMLLSESNQTQQQLTDANALLVEIRDALQAQGGSEEIEGLLLQIIALLG